MSNKETNTLEPKLLYDGEHKIEKVIRELDDGKTESEVIKKGKTISTMVYNTKTEKYIFIESYKLAADMVTAEVIKGVVEEEEKETQSVKRIIAETIGYKVEVTTHIMDYFMSPKDSDETCSLFYVEVSEKIDEDEDEKHFLSIEKLGLGGKLFLEDPEKLMLSKDDKKTMKKPYQVLDAKSLIGIMWVENNNTLKNIARVLTNTKIRSL
tara:strand:+ start:1509 stop:2138 length:630 start_codon:yes stop_codon:yes gene_type:complete